MLVLYANDDPTEHTTRWRRKKKSNQYSASKGTWLSFFRPCTCALILLLIWSLYTRMTHAMHGDDETAWKNDRFFRLFFLLCVCAGRRKQQTTYFAQPLASNVIAIIGFAISLSIATAKVHHHRRRSTKTIQALGDLSTLTETHKRKQQAKVTFVAAENLFTFALNLNRLKYEITNPIYSANPFCFDCIFNPRERSTSSSSSSRLHKRQNAYV